MRTITDIIKDLGGAPAIASTLERVSRDAVYKWQDSGIPDRHWNGLIQMSGGALDAETLFTANKLARGEIAMPAASSTEAA
jgi:hypothetical protein